MPVDPWATTTAQEFPPQSPPGWASFAERTAKQKREMFDLRASVLANVSDVVADLRAKQAALEAQQAFLSGQSSGYPSTKVWDLQTGTSGTNAWELLAYDSTCDDEYTFQASSTGVLKIELSASVLLNNGGATALGKTSRGYSLSWSGGSLAWDERRSAMISGVNCGAIFVTASHTDIVTVPSNATVTLQTRRAKWSPVAPDTTWHGTRDTTVVVTRVGI